MSFQLVGGGQVVYPAYVSYLSLEFSTGNTNLSWPTEYQNLNPVVAAWNRVKADADNLTLTLPDARKTSVGQSFIIDNYGTHAFNLLTNDGVVLDAIAAPSVQYFVLSDNSTQAGTWITTGWGGGYAAVTSVAAAPAAGVATNNLDISGSPITVSGTFVFDLKADLLALTSFDAGTATGIAVRTAGTPTYSWSLRTLVGTAQQIAITNGNGVAGNPTIGLEANVTGIDSMQIGNIQIEDNAIEAFAGNEILLGAGIGADEIKILSNEVQILNGTVLELMAADDTHYVGFDAGTMASSYTLTLPTTAPTAGQVMTAGSITPTALIWSNAASFSGSSTANTLPYFTNDTGTIGDTGITVGGGGLNELSGLQSVTVQDLAIGSAGSTIISSTTSIQFNSNVGYDTIVNRNLTLLAAGEIHLNKAGNDYYSGFSGNNSAIANNVWILPAADGASGSFITTNGFKQLSFSSVTVASLTKAWVTFQGSTATIYEESNVGSVASAGTGTYTITFTTAFSNTYYGMAGYAYDAGGTTPGIVVITNIISTSQCTVKTYNLTGSAVNFGYVALSFFGN